MTFDDSRKATADNIYENFDFSYNIVDAGGWDADVPGEEMARPIYVEDPEDPSEPTIKGIFTIRFEAADSVVPTEAFATVLGEQVGNIMGGHLKDYVIESADLPTP